jgi:hypothetical protein
VGGLTAPWMPNGNQNSLYTTISWSYHADANNSVSHDASWYFQGPATMKPMTTFPKVGASGCEQ